MITRVGYNYGAHVVNWASKCPRTVVVTGKHIDILMYACAHTDTDAHPQNVYSHKSTHTLKHRYTEATVYTQVYIL